MMSVKLSSRDYFQNIPKGKRLFAIVKNFEKSGAIHSVLGQLTKNLSIIAP
uniref:Uncharacterized protein n=1 Tax=Amphimedon queenslandica TaxID=400682 RepID=A0A1X7VHR5_AMPQE